MAEIAFNILSILLFPVTSAGYVIWVAKALMSGRNSGVSGTAQGPLSARWFMRNLGTRTDGAANRLMPVVPGVSHTAIRLISWPMLLGHRLTGHVPAAFRYPFEGEIPVQYEASARVSFFDDVIHRYVPRIRQLVILGAGFDTRAYRPPARGMARCFEVDLPATQAVKREMLRQTGIDAGGVTFVAADFQEDDWLARLVEAGLDSSQPVLDIWEGVVPYLSRAAVEDTLRRIAAAPGGAVVAFDYMTTEPLEAKGLYWRYARAATRAGGEPLKFGIDSTPPSRDRLAEALRGCGLALVEHRTLGQETGGRRAWGGFAVAAAGIH